MATVSEYVEIEVDLDDFDDKEIIEELEDRGYTVSKHQDALGAIYAWERGDKKEALVLLEREYPELRGLSQLIN